MFYKIEESVTTQGHYIVLDGIYETEAAAQAAIARLPSNQRMRAVAYVTGSYNGPVRASEARDRY